MKPINIQHFMGETICTEIGDVQMALKQSVNGANEFLIAQDPKEYPYLTVLVNGAYANVNFVSDEESAGFQAFSEDAGLDLDPEETTIFYVNTPSEEIEIYNDYVIPKELAMEIALEFAQTGALPSCTDWDEL